MGPLGDGLNISGAAWAGASGRGCNRLAVAAGLHATRPDSEVQYGTGGCRRRGGGAGDIAGEG